MEVQFLSENSNNLIELVRNSKCLPDRFDHLAYSLKQVSVEGLYLEFGVREGESINYLAEIISPSIIYGFDSFEGLPEDWKRKKDGSSIYPKGTFAVNKLPTVHHNVVLVEGWFNNTLPLFKREYPRNIAFINIDSDLYSSAKTILTNLNEQIVPGTILYFDELAAWGEKIYKYDNWEEEEYKALLEWMEEFRREVEPVSRNNVYGATLKVKR